MNAPTIWEAGRMTGTQVTRLAVVACVVLIGVDTLLTGRLGPVFDFGFTILCIGVALAVRPRDFFRAAMLPPFLLLGVVALLSLVARGAVAADNDGFFQGIVSGLAHHSGALFAGFVNALVVLGIRMRMRYLRRDRVARATSPYAVHARPHVPQQRRSSAPEWASLQPSNRAGSPAPRRRTSGDPEE